MYDYKTHTPTPTLSPVVGVGGSSSPSSTSGCVQAAEMSRPQTVAKSHQNSLKRWVSSSRAPKHCGCTKVFVGLEHFSLSQKFLLLLLLQAKQ